MVSRVLGVRPARELVSWVAVIARHLLIDVNRKRDAWREIHGSKMLQSLAKGSSPGKQIQRFEDAIEMAAALERLPEESYGLVLELRFFAGLSAEEVGKRMGLECWSGSHASPSGYQRSLAKTIVFGT